MILRAVHAIETLKGQIAPGADFDTRKYGVPEADIGWLLANGAAEKSAAQSKAAADPAPEAPAIES